MSAGRDADAGSTSPFIRSCRVYWEDTDAGGVVYHASYLRFLERARTEWLRDLGGEQRGLSEREDLVFAVRSMRIDFLAPARLDDELAVSVEVIAVRPASLVFAQRIRCGERLLIDAGVRVACLTASGFRPRPCPAWLLQRIQSSDKAQ